MNIFYLDHDPKLAAEYACSEHCVKMILESFQMLSTAHRILDGAKIIGKTKTGRSQQQWVHPNKLSNEILYKGTHSNHPSAAWVRLSAAHYDWLYNLAIYMNEELKYRYGRDKNHASVEKLGETLKFAPAAIEHINTFTPPPQCMPDHCKLPDTVLAYRNFYNLEKSRFATWKVREIPYWYKPVLIEEIT